MDFEDGPQLALTTRRKALAAVGIAMFAAQTAAAAILAPVTTGQNADGPALAIIWPLTVIWSAATVLLLVRQADLPDVATASFIVTIAAFATFAGAAALNARGTTSEVNLTDAVFFGVTTGALTALLVWAVAMGVARLLRLPTTAALRDAK